MRILLIVGACLQVNNSANLCHCAYIDGLVKTGNEVVLLSMSKKNRIVDESIKLPAVKQHITYNGTLYYFLLSHKSQNNSESINIIVNKPTQKSKKFLSNVKKVVKGFYGVHDVEKAWIIKSGHYHNNQEFDCVISLAWPPASHRLAANLIKRKHIKCKYWCEIWEDPWQTDLYSQLDKCDRIKEEKKLVSLCDKVIYVSPITLKKQQEMFPESANKMIWIPLPYYYKKEYKKTNHQTLSYGYFGDYYSHVRNLEPFYQASKIMQINANICGNPNNLFQSTDNINIMPRISLLELEKIEEQTDVLVFVCNLYGGQIPGKIYQYSATEKIILFILDGTDEEKKLIENYFEKFNRYIFCDNTVESIQKAINCIENGEMGLIKNQCVEAFSPTNIVKTILEKCQ